MSKPEPPSHTFLLRVWVESTPEELGRLRWRGFIAHLPDEERCYVESFNEITSFIWRHLGWPNGTGSPPQAPTRDVHGARDERGGSEGSDGFGP